MLDAVGAVGSTATKLASTLSLEASAGNPPVPHGVENSSHHTRFDKFVEAFDVGNESVSEGSGGCIKFPLCD